MINHKNICISVPIKTHEKAKINAARLGCTLSGYYAMSAEMRNERIDAKDRRQISLFSSSHKTLEVLDAKA